jgi:hypothetical protein
VRAVTTACSLAVPASLFLEDICAARTPCHHVQVAAARATSMSTHGAFVHSVGWTNV